MSAAMVEYLCRKDGEPSAEPSDTASAIQIVIPTKQGITSESRSGRVTISLSPDASYWVQKVVVARKGE